MSKSLVKKLILACVIIVVILIIVIIFVKINIKNTEIQQGNEAEERIIYEDIQDMLEQDSLDRIYTMSKCVTYYLDILNKEELNEYDNGDTEELEEERLNQIYNILSKNYIEKNNITLENVENFVPTVKEILYFIPLKIKYVSNEEEKLYQYAIYGCTMNLNYANVQYLYFIINYDEENEAFSIEPLNDKYNDINDISLTTLTDKIEQNDDNYLEIEILNNESLIKNYIDTYKKLALGAPEIAYNYLDEDYRNERFGDLYNFKKYIEDNKDEIESLQPEKYMINDYEEYTQYVIRDKYENDYIFNEMDPMDFTLQLDTYTIPTENFTTTYNSSDVQNKVMLNVDKWIKMLNNRDYEHAYSVLNDTYRNNTFGAEEEFETTMREILPLHYKVEYSDFSEENGKYIQNITLTDITGGENDNIEISIIMQLEEDLDFVMSFNFKE